MIPLMDVEIKDYPHSLNDGRKNESKDMQLYLHGKNVLNSQKEGGVSCKEREI